MSPEYASTREVREVMAEEETYGSFRLSCRRPDHDLMVVTIVGDLDLQSVAQTQAFLRHATARSPRHLIIDMSQDTGPVGFQYTASDRKTRCVFGPVLTVRFRNRSVYSPPECR